MAGGRPSGNAALQEALERLGAKRVEATLLAALLEDDALGTQDIVQGTGLRQPEVSVGMQVLRGRGWVEAEAIPRKGKGRPMHQYRLVAKPAAVRKHYADQGKEAIQAYKDAIAVLEKKLKFIDDIPTIGYLPHLHVGILAEAMERAAVIASKGTRRGLAFMAPFCGEHAKANTSVIRELESICGLSPAV